MPNEENWTPQEIEDLLIQEISTTDQAAWMLVVDHLARQIAIFGKFFIEAKIDQNIILDKMFDSASPSEKNAINEAARCIQIDLLRLAKDPAAWGNHLQ